VAEQEQLRWLLEPPGEGRAHVYVALGEGTKLSPTVKEALDRFLAAFQETDDVQGFMVNSVTGFGSPIMDDAPAEGHRVLGLQSFGAGVYAGVLRAGL
jgi:hypothetical protein